MKRITLSLLCCIMGAILMIHPIFLKAEGDETSVAHAISKESKIITSDPEEITGQAIFTTGPMMNTPRQGHYAATLPDGRVAVFGGHTTGFVASSSAEVWTPGNPSFLSLSMNFTHSWPVFVKLNDDRYLLAGGCYNSGVPSHARSEIFNPSDNSFTAVGNMARSRAITGGAAMIDGRVVMAGGWYQTGPASYGELFNTATQTFSAIGPFAIGRSHTIVVPASDGKAVVMGGSGVYGGGVSQYIEQYDPATGIITTLKTQLFDDEPGWGTSSNYRQTDMQKLADGRYMFLSSRNVSGVLYATLFTFDPVTKNTERFLTTPELPSPSVVRYECPPIIDIERGRVHLVVSVPAASYREIQIYSVKLESGVLTHLSNSYNPGYWLAHPSYSLLNDGRLMICGGSSQYNNFNAIRNTLFVDLQIQEPEQPPIGAPIPLSHFSVLIGILLIISFLIIRYKR